MRAQQQEHRRHDRHEAPGPRPAARAASARRTARRDERRRGRGRCGGGALSRLHREGPPAAPRPRAGARAPGGRARVPPRAFAPAVIGRREPRTRTLTRPRGEPALQQVRGRARVLALREGPRHPLGDARGEALVVHLHRHAVAEPRESAAQTPASRVSGRCRCRAATAAARRPRARPRARARARAARAARAWWPGCGDGRDRRDDRAGGVAQRAAAARAAVVEREHPHRARQAQRSSIAARAASIASPSFSGSRPPAWAIVSRPPPPPPTISAAALDQLARLDAARDELGRDARDEVHAAVGGRAEQDRRVARRPLSAVERRPAAPWRRRHRRPPRARSPRRAPRRAAASASRSTPPAAARGRAASTPSPGACARLARAHRRRRVLGARAQLRGDLSAAGGRARAAALPPPAR